MRFDTLLNEWVREAHTRHTITVHQPRSHRPLLHVRDAVRILTYLIGRSGQARGVFNIGTPTSNYTKQEAAASVQRAIPTARIQLVNGAIDTRDYQVSFAKIAKYLPHGFAAISLEDGAREIARMIETGGFGNPYEPRYANAEVRP